MIRWPTKIGLSWSISPLFPSWHRLIKMCFYGTIKRFTDSDGIPTVFGRIKVDDVYVCTQAADQFELGIKLDQLVIMVYYRLI
jgi:hypothetical protein